MTLVRMLGAVLAMLGVVAAVEAPAQAEIAWPTTPGGPVGANDWSCRATSQRPEPVILVHGTFGDHRDLLDPISAAIKRRGFCVFSLDYGNRGTRDIATSARELAAYVTKVRRATRAAKVDIVGHSQGGMMPRYYIKFLGGARYVDDLVGLVPSNHGTGQPTGPADDWICYSCDQEAEGSALLARLNRGDETPGPVSYTQISTRYDELIVPHTASFLTPGPQTTNVTLQDRCPLDVSDHALIPMDPAAIAWTLDALTHRGPARAGFRPRC